MDPLDVHYTHPMAAGPVSAQIHCSPALRLPEVFALLLLRAAPGRQPP